MTVHIYIHVYMYINSINNVPYGTLKQDILSQTALENQNPLCGHDKDYWQQSQELT